MYPDPKRRIAAKFVFIIGLFLMLLGSAAILGTMSGTSRVSVFTAFIFVIIGAVCAVFAIKLNRRSLYLFFAAFFIQVGFFLFLIALGIIAIPFSELWPLISVFAGLALIPAGWHRYHRLRSRYVVPALAFVILGCVLMLFSLKMVPFSFSQFIINWWPLLIALAGLVLVLIALSTSNGGKSGDPHP
ncbi:hypothetical protein [Breznakiella homolactica]|uniref:DUF5668 domain-containing protein n=1 Tax=Breznakiella homolactica TaxID=2798577 RepID=A0A7T7XRM0_9SPIR|nr:hypothetical protein [Breznakiella homolactica]QQO11206.1 hypothetical protein JFL75_09950 [Breznakiella homolactica]